MRQQLSGVRRVTSDDWRRAVPEAGRPTAGDRTINRFSGRGDRAPDKSDVFNHSQQVIGVKIPGETRALHELHRWIAPGNEFKLLIGRSVRINKG
jgi:hypothetical protein